MTVPAASHFVIEKPSSFDVVHVKNAKYRTMATTSRISCGADMCRRLDKSRSKMKASRSRTTREISGTNAAKRRP